MKNQATAGARRLFWVVAIAGLIWNLMGCMNYLMQMNPESMAGYPDAARALVESRPAWATGAFAIAVFGGVLGCILLMLRKSAAYYVFAASLFGVAVTNIHTFRVGGSTGIWIGSLLSLIVAAFLMWYSKMAERKGLVA